MEKKKLLVRADKNLGKRIASVFKAEYEVICCNDAHAVKAELKKDTENTAAILYSVEKGSKDSLNFIAEFSDCCAFIPLIALTDDKELQNEALKCGAWDFVPPDFSDEIIRNRVKNSAGRRNLENEKKINLELRQSKIKMDNLVNSIPGGIAIYKLSDTFETVFFSDGVAELSGHTREEYADFLANDASKIIYEHDTERVITSVLNSLRNNEPVNEIYRIRHKNGSLVWVRLNGVIIGEDDGCPIIHAVFQKPSKTAQLYDGLVNDSQNLIYICDTQNYDILYMNHTALKSIGKEGCDYSSQKCYEYLFGFDKPCKYCKMEEMKYDRYYTRDFHYPNGKIYSMRGKLIDWNGLEAHVEYIDDVTEMRKSEQENERLTQQLQSIMDNIPGGMCMYRSDKKGLHPIIHNQAFYKIFGYSEEHIESVERTTNYLNVHPDDLPELKKAVEHALEKNLSFSHTYRSFHDLGKRYIWIKLSGVIVPQGDGSKLCYISYIDITTEKETQEKLSATKQTLETLRRGTQNTLDNYHSLINAVPGGIAQYELKDGKILTRYFSDGICEFTGMTRAEREEKCNDDILPFAYEEDRPAIKAAMEHAYATHEDLNLTYRICNKDGGTRWIKLRAAYSEGPEGECLYHAVFTDIDKLKEIEQKLQENKLRYEVAIKNSGINIWEYNIRTDCLNFISSSARVHQDNGRIEHYIPTIINSGNLRADSIKEFRSIFDALQSGAKEAGGDIWYKSKGDSGWWCERVIYTTIFDTKGAPVKAFGAGKDVTREKEAEKKFHDELSFRKTIQSNNLASALIDLSANRVLEINSRFGSIISLEKDTADEYFADIRKGITDKAMRAEFKKRFNCTALLNMFGSGEFAPWCELTRTYDTGRIYWVKYSVHLLQRSDTGHIIANIACIDITHEKTMNTIMSSVTASDYDFFMIVDYVSKPVIEFVAGDISDSFAEQDDFEEKLSKLIDSEVCEADVERVRQESKSEIIWKKFESYNSYKFSFSIRTPDGKINRKQIQVTKISPERKAILISRIDVTAIYEEQENAKKQLENALAAARKANRAKSDFLSRMSHDIRTPMNAVISLAEFGQKGDNISEEKEYFKEIEASGKCLLSIINDVLSLSKMEGVGLKLHEKIVSMPEFVADTAAVIAPLAKEKNITLKASQSGIMRKYIKFDPTYVRQVIVNLLSNAIKFTPYGGQVTFSVHNTPMQGNYLRNLISVKDTGIGISEEFLPKIFAPFEQEDTQNDSARQGTGLGLSIVKSIVEEMGGKIWVESKKGEGSTFYVEWVLEAAEADYTAPAEYHYKKGELKGKNILLAEDHPLNAEISKKILQNAGLEVSHAENGKRAVEIFQNSAPDYFAAVLMDIRMPVMNGLEAAKAIRSLDRIDAATTPIIAMTANSFDDDMEKSKSAGMNAHLTKPIETDKLYKTLASLINKHG